MSLPLPLALALRDLRSGLSGLYVLIVCVILGVTAIAGIGSLSAAVREGLEREGQPLLGGDIELALVQRRLDPAERQALARLGQISEVASLRAMASHRGKYALIEVKAVDDAYPLYGALDIATGENLTASLAPRDGVHGVIAEPLLFERLGLSPRAPLTIGEARLDLRAGIRHEPDRLSDGLAFGPRVIMTHAALAATGLVKPGSLVTWRYRLKLNDPAGYRQTVEAIKKDFPDAGWRIRARNEAAPGVGRYLDRLTFFLSLVALTTLVIGGVGIANAVKTFIDRRRRHIATLRLAGALPSTVFATYLCEVMLVACGAAVLGLALGALLPFLIDWLFGRIIPLPLHLALYPAPLAAAAAFGLLTSLVFSVWPLAQVKVIGPLDLIRRAGKPLFLWPGLAEIAMLATGAIALIALTFLELDPDWMVLWYVSGVVASFALLFGLGRGLVSLAERLAKPANALLRFAIANLYRAGTALPSVVLSLGLGLTLFVTLSLIDRSLTLEIRSSLASAAPSFFFLDVDKAETAAFLHAIRQEKSIDAVVSAPMLRGRITKVKGAPAETVKAAPEGAWALRGDRGLTYSTRLPEGSRLVEGAWWPEDYTGPPLVSFTADVAQAIGLGIGDVVAVNVLGRELTAQVANLREVDWRSLGMNFVMVFSPNALSAAPHSTLITVSLAPEHEAAFLNRIIAAFPTVTAIRVSDALDAVAALLEDLLLAIRGVGGLTIFTGLLVLAGALATSLSARTYDAVVLKTYGATRRQLISVFALEFAIAGLVTSLFAILMGALAAFALSRFVLEVPFAFSLPIALAAALLSMGLTIAAGLATAWRALGAKPSSYLRDD